MKKSVSISISILVFGMLTCAALLVYAQSYNDAVAAFRRGQFETAFPALKRLAEDGDSPSQYLIGSMHEYGLSVPIDKQQAFFWYRKSAEKGNPEARLALTRFTETSVDEASVAARATAHTCDSWGNPKDSKGNACSNTDRSAVTVVWSDERQRVEAELAKQERAEAEERQRAESQAAAREQSDACLARLKDDPALRPLYAKLPFDLTKSQSLVVLANTTKPTAKEKAALSAYSSEKERCLDIGNGWRKQNLPPEANALFTSYRTESVAVLADLYTGKITFGDAAKLRAKQASTFFQELDTLRRNYQAQIEANEKQRLSDEAIARAQKEAAEQQQAQNKAREQEIENQRLAQQQAQERAYQQARREQANQQFMQGLMLLEAARPKFPPPMFPPSVNCTSRAVGNTVQTNCN